MATYYWDDFTTWACSTQSKTPQCPTLSTTITIYYYCCCYSI